MTERWRILDEARYLVQHILIGAKNMSTHTLFTTVSAKIFFIQIIAAGAKRLHDKFTFFMRGDEIIFFKGETFLFTVGHSILTFLELDI